MITQIILDGYNIIHAKNFPGRKGRSLEAQRDYLIHLVRQYAARKRINCTIVFDSKFPFSRQQKRYQRVQVRFAPAHTEADRIIQDMVRQSKNPRTLLVISSDREIQHTARVHGAQVMASEAFLQKEIAPYPVRQPEPEEPEEHKPEAALSDREVEEWLRLFSQGEDADESAQ